MRRTKAEIMAGVDCDKSKFIDNNTVEYSVEGIRLIRLHLIDILTFKPNGMVTYNSGGWKTVTTKDRMNKFGSVGAQVWQEKNIWYIGNKDVDSVFYDGIVLNSVTGEFRDSVKVEDTETKKWMKLINSYCKELTGLESLPVPGGGDCWDCALFDQNLGAGEKSTSREHLESHLTEKYIHGSLIWNALKWARYNNPSVIWSMDIRSSIVRSVKRYFKANLGLAG